MDVLGAVFVFFDGLVNGEVRMLEPQVGDGIGAEAERCWSGCRSSSSFARTERGRAAGPPRALLARAPLRGRLPLGLCLDFVFLLTI